MADAFPNPLTGDPNQLEADGTLYSETSDAIANAIAEIRQLGSDLFSSHAVTALNRNQGDVVEKVTRIQYRYYEAGGALVNYARALREAQTQAANAIAAHGPLADQASTLLYRIDEASRLAHEPGPDQVVHIMQLQQLMAEQREVQARQADAQRMWNDAKAMKDAAAQAARIAIHVGDEKNDLNDDLWDSLATVIPVLLIIDRIAQEVLKIVSLVLTILAIVFAVLSLIFPILSPVAAALFGYAQLVNLAIAVLALLAFIMDGFHLMDLVLVGISIAAMFAAYGLGQVAGAAAQGAIEGSLKGVDEAAADALGGIAKNAITEGAKDFTKAEMKNVLAYGSDEAQQLFDEIGDTAVNGLNSLAADQISSLKDAAKGAGLTLGGYVQTGLDQTKLPGLLHAAENGVSNWATSGGLGNLDWAKDGMQAVQDNIIHPAQVLQQQGNALLGGLTHWNPDGAILNPNGPFPNPSDTSAHDWWNSDNPDSPVADAHGPSADQVDGISHGVGGFSSGDMNGDALGDKISSPMNDWIGAASRGHWGGAAQWAVHQLGPVLTGPNATGAIGDQLGDLFGKGQDDQTKLLASYVKAHQPQGMWGPTDWDH